jgi:hypothetical protein
MSRKSDLQEGYEVYIVADACGGASKTALIINLYSLLISCLITIYQSDNTFFSMLEA